MVFHILEAMLSKLLDNVVPIQWQFIVFLVLGMFWLAHKVSNDGYVLSADNYGVPSRAERIKMRKVTKS